MNYGDLKTRAAYLATVAGWSEANPQPDWPALINLALEEFSWEAEYNVSQGTVSTIVNQAEYALPAGPPWKRLTDILYGASTLIHLTDENQVRRSNPYWLTTPATTPDRAWFTDPNTIRLYPTPNAVAVLTLRGIQADAPLVNDTDSPLCPTHYHEGIALLAAWRHGKQFSDEKSLAKLGAYRAEAERIIADLREYLGQESIVPFQRRVLRDLPTRKYLGWYSNVTR